MHVRTRAGLTLVFRKIFVHTYVYTCACACMCMHMRAQSIAQRRAMPKSGRVEHSYLFLSKSPIGVD